MKSYTEQQRLPNLQELADSLCEDEELEYVELQSKATASLNKITVGESKSIFTKIKKYPYEFEINNQLQLASIDGVKIADTTNNTVTIDKEEYEQMKKDIQELKIALNNMKGSPDYANAIEISNYRAENNKFTCPQNGFIFVNFYGTTNGTKWCYVRISDFPLENITLADNQWGIPESFSCPINQEQIIYFDVRSTEIMLKAYFIPYK